MALTAPKTDDTPVVTTALATGKSAGEVVAFAPPRRDWRERYLLTTSAANIQRPVWSEDYGQLDGSIFYSLNEHVKMGLQGTNLLNARTFLDVGDTVLAPLGGSRLMDFTVAIGYGTDRATFWIGGLHEGDGFRESHIAFTAPDRAAVHAFFEAATARGAEVLHEPRVWPEYHASYYGAFVLDPDGHRIEAVCHASEAAENV